MSFSLKLSISLCIYKAVYTASVINNVAFQFFFYENPKFSNLLFYLLLFLLRSLLRSLCTIRIHNSTTFSTFQPGQPHPTRRRSISRLPKDTPAEADRATADPELRDLGGPRPARPTFVIFAMPSRAKTPPEYSRRTRRRCPRG